MTLGGRGFGAFRLGGCGFGQACAALFLCRVQIAEGAGELALEEALVADEFGECVVVFGVAVKGPGLRVGAALLVVLLRQGIAFGLEVEQAGIQAFDQGVLNLVEGLEAATELVLELEEFVGIAVGRDELAGGHAVDEAVAAGDSFAFWGAGASAFCAFWRLALVCASVAMGCGPVCVMAGVDLDQRYGNGDPPTDSIVGQAVLGSGVQRLQVVEKVRRICVASCVTEKGFLSFAAGKSRKSRVSPIAAKVRKPCSELNRRVMPVL